MNELDTVSDEGTASNATRPTIEVENLTVHFDTPKGQLRAVHMADFTVQPGRTLGIVGESGSGKSVLSRAVMGILPRAAEISDDSVIRFNDKRIWPEPETRMKDLWGSRISMIFQDPMTSLTPVMTVGQQLREVVRQHEMVSRKEADRRALDMLRQVGISDPEARMKQHPHKLSGGMRQRVMIALALICSPDLLMADEPTTALDVTVQHQILNLLDSMQKQNGMSMVLVTHDLGLVAGRTDEAMVMYAGAVVERAPTSVLFAHMHHPYTQALFNSLPRLEHPSHTPLESVPGLPPRVVNPRPGCAFAPRCPNSRPRCTREDPPTVQGVVDGHTFACFYPVDTPEGDEARAANLREASSQSEIYDTDVVLLKNEGVLQ